MPENGLCSYTGEMKKNGSEKRVTKTGGVGKRGGSCRGKNSYGKEE